MKRDTFHSNTVWESKLGYSRGVRVGSSIFISGTTATDGRGEIVGVGDPYAQTMQSLRNIETTLIALGSAMWDVVRTRIYVKDVTHWEEIARAHAEFFSKCRPATTLVEVSRLIHPDILVEIEADALVNSFP